MQAYPRCGPPEKKSLQKSKSFPSVVSTTLLLGFISRCFFTESKNFHSNSALQAKRAEMMGGSVKRTAHAGEEIDQVRCGPPSVLAPSVAGDLSVVLPNGRPLNVGDHTVRRIRFSALIGTRCRGFSILVKPKPPQEEKTREWATREVGSYPCYKPLPFLLIILDQNVGHVCAIDFSQKRNAAENSSDFL